MVKDNALQTKSMVNAGRKKERKKGRINDIDIDIDIDDETDTGCSSSHLCVIHKRGVFGWNRPDSQ